MATDLGLELFEELMDGRSRENESKENIVPWDEHTPDPRFTRNSYSSDLLFNGCERKYQLKKLMAAERIPDEDWRTRLTFGFGHAVGAAVQSLLMGKTRDQIVFDMFVNWKEDLFAENEKQKKTFFHAMLAIDKLEDMMSNGFLEEYELVYYNGIPAAELSYRIHFPNGFTDRGYVDIVLRNKESGKFAIFEIKTDSGYNMQPAKYKNSSQATGYSVVLDKIEPGQVDYTVYYLVYMTRQEKWECFEFVKTMAARAQWVQDKLEDISRRIDLVKSRGNHGIWPIRGNHCLNYNRECEFLGVCQLDTKSLVKPLYESQLEEETGYTFELDWQELLGE